MIQTTTTFTPGPWRAVEAVPGHDRDWTVTAAGRGVMVEIYERGGTAYDELLTDEAAANARLIAAAPDLYEVLRDLVTASQSLSRWRLDHPDGISGLWLRAADALAKADGR